MSKLQAAFRCLISKKELNPVKEVVLREAKIECPLELRYPWMSMIPESGDEITGGGRKTISPIERMHSASPPARSTNRNNEV
jgi:hypothetical protein